MTLPRTIRRREQRKRAKLRPRSRGPALMTPAWVHRDLLLQLRGQLALARHIHRDYDKP